MTLGSAAKVEGRGQKSTKRAGKFWVSFNSPAGLDTSRLVWACLEAYLPWGRDVFHKTGLETTRTSPKPLSHFKSRQAVLTNRQDWRNIQSPTTRCAVGIAITDFDEFLGKRRIKCHPINKS